MMRWWLSRIARKCARPFPGLVPTLSVHGRRARKPIPVTWGTFFTSSIDWKIGSLSGTSSIVYSEGSRPAQVRVTTAPRPPRARSHRPTGTRPSAGKPQTSRFFLRQSDAADVRCHYVRAFEQRSVGQPDKPYMRETPRGVADACLGLLRQANEEITLAPWMVRAPAVAEWVAAKR